MKKDNLFSKVNKERKRIRWTTPVDALKIFITTMIFIIVLTLILFGFSTAILAIFDAIKT